MITQDTFFASMKNKKAQNHITMLKKEDETLLEEPKDISEEAIGFYHKLLGQTSSGMPTAKQSILREGPMLTRSQ